MFDHTVFRHNLWRGGEKKCCGHTAHHCFWWCNVLIFNLTVWINGKPCLWLCDTDNAGKTCGMLMCIFDCFWRASIMSEVLPRINLKCEEITMAVYWMQNLQLLSNTGEKCCKYNVAYILTRTIFSVDLEVELVLCIPEDLLVSLRFVKPLSCTIGLIFPKDFKWRVALHVCNRDVPHTCLLFPFRMRCYSAIHVIGAFTWNAATRRFQECQKVRCLHCLASLFPALLSFQSLFFTDGRLGAVTQHTERQRWLIRSFACISNYSSIPGEICYLWITVLTLQARLVMMVHVL